MATTPYLDVAGFKGATIVPSAYVDAIDAAESGWTLRKLTFVSAWINARLAKRYAVPFAAPYPEAILDWVERLTSWAVLLKRGIDPTDEQVSEIKARAESAAAEIKEAAESREGLFELPLRADDPATAVSRGAPLGYSEQSPYTWTDVQAEAAIDETSSGEGS